MPITPGPGPSPLPSPGRTAGRGPGLWGRLQVFAFPAPCLACGRPLGPGPVHLGLCRPCRGALVRPAPGCAVCGEPIPGARFAPLPSGYRCGECRHRPPAFDALRAAWEYRGPLIPVIRALKFRGLDYLGTHLGAELLAVVRELGGEWDLVVPVPLHWRRRWSRGFNQAERMARPLADALGVPCLPALRRRRATRAQVGLPRRERLANPRGAFAPRYRASLGASPTAARRIAGRRILLIDDVVTSGATLRAAAEALVAAGARRVAAIAAARTPAAP